MSFHILLPDSSFPVAGPAVYTGQADKVKELEFVPNPIEGFTGFLAIEYSSAGTPGAFDWFPITTVELTAHSSNFAIDVFTNRPWIRARVVEARQGTISVFISN